MCIFWECAAVLTMLMERSSPELPRDLNRECMSNGVGENRPSVTVVNASQVEQVKCAMCSVLDMSKEGSAVDVWIV